MKAEAHVLDVSAWKPDKSYEDSILLCHELGLVEMLVHGDVQYGRITQNGVNVFCVLLTMAGNSTDDTNKLKAS
jgi:hypothetical protein